MLCLLGNGNLNDANVKNLRVINEVNLQLIPDYSMLNYKLSYLLKEKDEFIFFPLLLMSNFKDLLLQINFQVS